MKIERNLAMITDFYEFTMANGAFLDGMIDKKVVFTYFYRKNPENGGYSIFAGLKQLVEFINDMHFTKEDITYLRSKQCFDEGFLTYLSNFKFTGSVQAMKEGTVMYPNEPIITITATWGEAQLIETMLLLICNHQSLIATKASRIVRAANGRPVLEFGARRAHGCDAAVYGARAAYIGGVDGTATTYADEEFAIPASGTMAHSWIQFYNDDYTAFKKYAETYPDQCTLLVDTYHVLKSGVPNAIRVAKEVLEPQGKRLKGIRIDSGDLAYLSKEARKMLDRNDMEDCKIVISNSMDEYLIHSLLDEQKAPIDIFGVGERLITSKAEPVFGGVYKLSAVYNDDTNEFEPRIKISENIEKITNPGVTNVWRIYRNYKKENCQAIADLVALTNEDYTETASITLYHPDMPSLKIMHADIRMIPLLHPVITNGVTVFDDPSLADIRTYVKQQLDQMWTEELRFENPHQHYINLSNDLYDLKKQLLEKHYN